MTNTLNSTKELLKELEEAILEGRELYGEEKKWDDYDKEDRPNYYIELVNSIKAKISERLKCQREEMEFLEMFFRNTSAKYSEWMTRMIKGRVSELNKSIKLLEKI